MEQTDLCLTSSSLASASGNIPLPSHSRCPPAHRRRKYRLLRLHAVNPSFPRAEFPRFPVDVLQAMRHTLSKCVTIPRERRIANTKRLHILGNALLEIPSRQSLGFAFHAFHRRLDQLRFAHLLNFCKARACFRDTFSAVAAPKPLSSWLPLLRAGGAFPFRSCGNSSCSRLLYRK